jgi:hypothetical protein
MAFDLLETEMENNRLVRRLSGNDMEPLDFDVHPVDHPDVKAVIETARVRPHLTLPLSFLFSSLFLMHRRCIHICF